MRDRRSVVDDFSRDIGEITVPCESEFLAHGEPAVGKLVIDAQAIGCGCRGVQLLVDVQGGLEILEPDREWIVDLARGGLIHNVQRLATRGLVVLQNPAAHFSAAVREAN
jgi:hypothetical protein